MEAAERIGKLVAARCFKERGNHSQAHLLQVELAGWCQVAAELALRVADNAHTAALMEPSDRQDCETSEMTEEAKAANRAMIAEMEQDGGRTRIGNTPSCDLCGEQHSEERSCEERTAIVNTPRFKATHRGQVIGWYDTAAEAEAAIDAEAAGCDECGEIDGHGPACSLNHANFV
jgi:hypothetical protein